MKRILFGASLLLVTAFGFAANADTIRFELTGFGVTTGVKDNTTDNLLLKFDIDTSAPFISTSGNAIGRTEFGLGPLSNFSMQVFDSAGAVIADLGLSPGPNPFGNAKLFQTRLNLNNGVPQPGSNRLEISLGSNELTGTGPKNNTSIVLQSTVGIAGASGNFVQDLLFDDPTKLLSNIEVGLPIAIENLDSNLGPSTTGVQADSFFDPNALGNFLFDSITVSNVTPVDPPISAVPLPASSLLLLTGLGGVFVSFRRRRIVKV